MSKWQVSSHRWIDVSLILLVLIVSVAFAVNTQIQTYKDPAYTAQNSSFAQDETVYSKLTTNPSIPDFFIEYWQLNPLNLLLRKGPVSAGSLGELKDSYHLDYYQEPGNYGVNYLNNPQYAKPFRVIINSPENGNLEPNTPIIYSFYLVDRENQVIKNDLSNS